MVVVGGGIVGLTTAYLLTMAGHRVALFERGRLAHVDTGHTSGHLTMVTDTRLTTLVRKIGRGHAQATWDAGLAAIAQIDAVVRAHAIPCDFAWVDGYLHAPMGPIDPQQRGLLEREADLANELGFDAEFVAQVPFVGSPGIRFPQQARMHPLKYLSGLCRAITAHGGAIYEHSAVEAFHGDASGVAVGGHRVRCEDIVIATHNPLAGQAGVASATLLQTQLALYTSYAVAGRVPMGHVPDALWWDTADPYRYLRIHPQEESDLVILGGADHKTGQMADAGESFDRLERGLRALAPGVELTHRWSGQVIETPDGLPFIGSTAPHQYIATGFGGNGLTFGTIGAMMCADAILERRNPWFELFEPSRSAIRRGLWDYLKENADYPYYLIRDRFAGPAGRSVREIPRGAGRIIETRHGRVAAYRDEAGVVIQRSAHCTHLGCLVAWNPAECTWDCPCHGSRFTPQGDVVSGPATTPLKKLD